jgi:hypothetical protein
MSSVARKGNSMSRVEQIEPKPVARMDSNGSEPTMEQVRELLFGQTQRANDQRALELNQTIDALRAEMIERFAAMEARMEERAVETARRHSSTIEAIGVAISDLGAQVRKLAEAPTRK